MFLAPDPLIAERLPYLLRGYKKKKEKEKMFRSNIVSCKLLQFQGGKTIKYFKVFESKQINIIFWSRNVSFFSQFFPTAYQFTTHRIHWPLNTTVLWYIITMLLVVYLLVTNWYQLIHELWALQSMIHIKKASHILKSTHQWHCSMDKPGSKWTMFTLFGKTSITTMESSSTNSCVSAAATVW